MNTCKDLVLQRDGGEHFWTQLCQAGPMTPSDIISLEDLLIFVNRSTVVCEPLPVENPLQDVLHSRVSFGTIVLLGDPQSFPN